MPPIEYIALSIPIIALLIPIVALLSRHQQKMAQIMISQRADLSAQSQIEALKREVLDLRNELNQHTIEIDNLKQLGTTTSVPPIPTQIQERIRP